MGLIGPSGGGFANFQSFGVFDGLMPKQGPKALPVTIPFSGALTSGTIDLTQQQQSNVISFVQTIYVDNSSNPQPLTWTTGLPGQIMKCPAYSEGYFPVIACNPPVFNFNSTGGVPVQVIFLNIEIDCMVWTISPTGTLIVSDLILEATVRGNAVQVVGVAGTATDHSINGTAVAASATLRPANPIRQYIEFQAPWAGSGLWVNLAGGAAGPNLVGSFYMPPGQTKVYEGTFVPTNAITYYDPTGGLVLPIVEG